MDPSTEIPAEPPKTAKQLEKEAAKAAKLAKLAAKTEKKAQQTTAPKEKAQVSDTFVSIQFALYSVYL